VTAPRRIEPHRFALPALEVGALAVVLCAQAVLWSRDLHAATNYDEAVYLAALDALRHGQALGSQVFAAQFPGFYDLLRGISYLTGVGVVAVRRGMLAVVIAGTVGAWLVGRRYGGPRGGILTAALLVVAPPLDLFGWQVIADTPELALVSLALGVGTLSGVGLAAVAGGLLGAALTVKLTALTAAPALAWIVRDRLLPAAGGFAAVVAAELLAHVTALGSLWSSGVVYHERARHTPPVIPHPHRQILDQIPHRTPFFVLSVVALLSALELLRRRALTTWPLWLWVALVVLFLLVHKPLHYNHLIELPYALAIAAGATLGAALGKLPARASLAAALVLAVLVGAAWVQQLHRVDLARAPEPVSNVAAARALARLTPPGAMTIDDRPIISFLARRRVLGRFVDLALLRWETGSVTDGDLVARLPKVQAVVVSRALRTRPRVLAAVRREFRKAYDAGGVVIYVRDGSRSSR